MPRKVCFKELTTDAEVRIPEENLYIKYLKMIEELKIEKVKVKV